MFVDDFTSAKIAHLKKLADEERLLMAELDAIAGMKELETFMQDDWIIQEWLKTADASLTTVTVPATTPKPARVANKTPSNFITPQAQLLVTPPAHRRVLPRIQQKEATENKPETSKTTTTTSETSAESTYLTPESVNRKRCKSPSHLRKKSKLKMHEFRDNFVMKIDTSF